MVAERRHGGLRQDKQKALIDTFTSNIIVQTVQDDENLIQEKLVPDDTVSLNSQVQGSVYVPLSKEKLDSICDLLASSPAQGLFRISFLHTLA